MAMTMLEARRVTGGVDTHLDLHVAAALDPVGSLIGTKSFEVNPPATSPALVARELRCGGKSRCRRNRFLWCRAGALSSPTRRRRHRGRPTEPSRAAPLGKVRPPRRSGSCPRRAQWPREKCPEVKRRRSRSNPDLLVAKRSARQARVKALTQVRHLVVTAPDELRRRMKGLSVAALVKEGAKLRPTKSSDPVIAATKFAVSSLAHRIQALEHELTDLDEKINSLLADTAPELLAVFGVGPDTAAALLVTAGDNPERVRSEAAFAHLCGVAPIPASSGKSTGRFRLDSGGDRQANSALWRIVMVRIAHDPETTAYFERRLKEGRTKPEVIRILKRYVAREVYRYLPRG